MTVFGPSIEHNLTLSITALLDILTHNVTFIRKTVVESESMSHVFFLPTSSPQLSTSNFQFCVVQTSRRTISLLYWLISCTLSVIHVLLLFSLSDWSTLAQEKVLLSWILTSRSVYVLAPSKAWRPMCSGWTLPRNCPPGLICWWRAATMLLSSSKRSPQVQKHLRFV